VVVATDEEGKLLTQFEYKYAIDKTILNLPSGSVGEGMSPLEVAAQELREETESISRVLAITPEERSSKGVFDTTYNVSALALTLPEYL
jgi:8-oxo-dGTP pyrophosphatase MutT (NUDIX family)